MFIGSWQGFSARSAAELAERAAVGSPGIRGVTVTSEGPTQVAGRTGYFVRFTASNLAHVTFQAECAGVETGPASSGTVRVSIVCAAVDNRADAPPAGVIDQIVDSTHIDRQSQLGSQRGLVPASAPTVLGGFRGTSPVVDRGHPHADRGVRLGDLPRHQP